MPATCAPAATRSCSSAPPTSTAPRPSWPPPRTGETVADYCARLWGVQKALADGFRLSFDHYGRSSSPQNHRLTQHFAGRLADAGLISEVTEKQIYSPADGRFLPDRYIERHLPELRLSAGPRRPVRELHQAARPDRPHRAALGDLGFDRPRGARDQPPLPLRQSLMRDRLRAWIDTKTDWPVLSTSIARKWLDDGEGLQDRCDHPRPRLGHPGPARRRALARHGGQGLLRVVRRADRVHRARAAEWADANGLGEAAWRRWWREDEGAGGRHLRRVHGQGQRPLPHAVASRRRSSGRASRGSSSTTSRASTISITRAGNSRPPRAAASSWTRPSRPCRATTGAGG